MNALPRVYLCALLVILGSSQTILAADGETPTGFQSLFNGRDLTGWKPHPTQPGDWRVEDGKLIGSGPNPSHLYSLRGDYKDFHLRVEARINDGGNSGVYVRSSPNPARPANNPVWPDGYEAQINSTHWNQDRTGSLRGGTDHAPVVFVRDSPVPAGRWFELEMIVQGNRIVVVVDHKKTAEYIDENRLYSSGHIVLQQMDPQTVVEFRNIQIKNLVASDMPVPILAREPEDSGDFRPLFNGQDLSGWRVDRGDPDIWHVEDGVLVADARGDWRKQTFLLSEKDFSDFLFRFEFQIPKNADSGIVLLASPGEDHVEVNLRNFEEPPGLHAPTGALRWSTSGSGRDYLPTDRPAELGPDRAWNDAKIELRGGSLQVWVNGRQVRSTDLRQLAARPDALPALKREAGRIGFQSHTGTVRFRNLQIKSLVALDPPVPILAREPEDSGAFQPLFNGRDLTGWKPHPTQPGNWRVENGILIGSGSAVSHLYSERGDYKDFHLRVQARINDGGNSGVYFRAPFGPTFPENNPRWLAAYNAKLDEKRFGLLIIDGVLGRPPLGDKILGFQPGQWITQEIIVQGNHIEIKMNGTKTTDYTDEERHYSVGHIVLQQHGPQTVAEFRKIEIQELGSGSGPSLYVLSIGINDYPDRRLKLDCAAPDARDLRQAFLTHSRRQFPGGVQTRLLLDGQATRDNILEGLRWLAGKARGNDVAVVFYAGHGDSQIEGQFYLVPFDANLRKLGASGVSGEALRKALGDLPCTTMLILDACDSGAFDRKATKTRKTRALPTATDTMLRQMVNDEGLVVMCGAAKGKEAAEEDGHGFFTRAIVEGLSGKADFFKKGRVELYDLQAYVKTRVGQLSGDEQEPTISIPSTIRSFSLSKP